MRETLLLPSMVISGEMTGKELAMLKEYENNGADGLILLDHSRTDQEHEAAIGFLKLACRQSGIPVYAGGHTRRFEDIKKYIYAGAKMAIVDGGEESCAQVTREGAARFGRERIALLLTGTADRFSENRIALEESCSLVIGSVLVETALPFVLEAETGDEQHVAGICADNDLAGISGPMVSVPGQNLYELKHHLASLGCRVRRFCSAISWEELKTDDNGLIPAIVQDYRTKEVLMMAYMNRQALEDTLRDACTITAAAGSPSG